MRYRIKAVNPSQRLAAPRILNIRAFDCQDDDRRSCTFLS